MVKKNMSTGTINRGLRLGKLGLSLTGSFLGYQAQNLFLGETERKLRRRNFEHRASRRVREELGTLKGAAMKLGQILSLQTQTLDADSIEELAQLQMYAPAMHPTLARAQFKAALGRYPEEVFAEFEPEPLAAASLGQVHRAVTRRGEKVAVKIQYPAIRRSIENDFKLLRSAALPVRMSGHIPKALLDEIQRGFLEETDYVHEGKNIEFFAKGLTPLPHITVPKVYWEHTNDRVLTMSFIEGETVGGFLKRRPSSELRDKIGDRLLELYYFQLHRLRALHADHHPGNYLFQPDGGIGLVDFGCVKHISFDVSDVLRSCETRAWRQGEKDARRVLGHVFGQQVPYARAKGMLSTLECMADILFPRGQSTMVDFGKAEFLKSLGGALKKTVRDKLVNPEFAFVSRAEMGLCSLLHRLDARLSPTDVWHRVESPG